MRHLETLAAICALTFTTTAHAGIFDVVDGAAVTLDDGDQLEACESFDYIGYTQSAGKTFGDDDFGGSYATLAGLFAPRSDSVAYWCLQYQWNSAYANYHNGLGQADFAAPYEQAMGVAELNLDDWLDEDALAGVNIGASAGADVTLFGLTADVFVAKGKASAEGGEAYIEVMGATVLDKSFSTTLSKSYPVTFFSATQGVDLGIFALVARAELTGTMGATASLSPSSDGVTGTVTPGAALEVNAEAIVDIVVASAGVTGSLSLLDASVPIVATIDSDGWSLTVDIVVTALEGCIEIFGEFMGIGDSTVIADWDGVTLFDQQLFGQSGGF